MPRLRRCSQNPQESVASLAWPEIARLGSVQHWACHVRRQWSHTRCTCCARQTRTRFASIPTENMASSSIFLSGLAVAVFDSPLGEGPRACPTSSHRRNILCGTKLYRKYRRQIAKLPLTFSSSSTCDFSAVSHICSTVIESRLPRKVSPALRT
jgi:hypothetical protein